MKLSSVELPTCNDYGYMSLDYLRKFGFKFPPLSSGRLTGADRNYIDLFGTKHGRPNVLATIYERIAAIRLPDKQQQAIVDEGVRQADNRVHHWLGATLLTNRHELRHNGPVRAPLAIASQFTSNGVVDRYSPATNPGRSIQLLHPLKEAKGRGKTKGEVPVHLATLEAVRRRFNILPGVEDIGLWAHQAMTGDVSLPEQTEILPGSLRSWHDAANSLVGLKTPTDMPGVSAVMDIWKNEYHWVPTGKAQGEEEKMRVSYSLSLELSASALAASIFLQDGVLAAS